MAKETKLQKILKEMYVELYKASTPSADFEELMKNAPINEQGKKVIDYMAYEIDKNEFDNIVDTIMSKHKLSKNDQHRLKMSIYLGASPKYKKNGGY